MESQNQEIEKILIEVFKANPITQVKECFTLLNKLFSNIVANPNEMKFRNFNMNNEHLKTKVLNLERTIELMACLGYSESKENADILVLESKDLSSVNSAIELINKCLVMIERKMNFKTDESQNNNLNDKEASEGGLPVKLLIYDITNGMAKNFSQMLIGKRVEGVWHTGIVVFDTEYYFGGGICKDKPKQTPYGIPVKEIHLGYTHLPQDLFEEFLVEIKDKYSAITYNLINNNCNHFTNAAAEFLMGKGIPDEILKQHEVLLNSPMGSMIMPMLQQMGQGSVPNMFENRK